MLAAISARLEQLTAASSAPSTQIDARVTNNIQVNATIEAPVGLVGFDKADRIGILPALVTAAFNDNPRLIEYCRMAETDRVDPALAAPFVIETLMDLVRRVHKNPIYRNIYLSANRADQVMVCVDDARAKTDEKWEVRSLPDVVRILFDGVAKAIRQIIVTDKDRAQLPMEVQSAVAWIPILYESEPDRFVREGKQLMAAHLSNTRPTHDITTMIIPN